MIKIINLFSQLDQTAALCEQQGAEFGANLGSQTPELVDSRVQFIRKPLEKQRQAALDQFSPAFGGFLCRKRERSAG